MSTEPSRTISVSAPGSLMLLGEHAVLHGHRALVGAINRRMTVRLAPMEGHALRIVSALGDYRTPLNALVDHPSFRFVLEAVRAHHDELPSGMALHIDSEFSSTIGFGSSAAVTVAVHAALLEWLLGEPPEPETVFAHSLETVRTVQGRGSGADVAASVFGGIVAYTTAPSFDPVPVALPLTAVYCGYKTPTPDVVMKVELARIADPAKFERIYAEIDRSTEAAIDCLRRRDLPGFGEVLNRNHGLMDAMGVNTPELEEIVGTLSADPEIFGAKISGSGLGDCAVGIGHAELQGLRYPVHHLEITPLGCNHG